MLKKHGLSPSALLRINSVEGSASFVLAALGGSTYRTEYAFASPAFAEAAPRRQVACCGRAGQPSFGKAQDRF